MRRFAVSLLVVVCIATLLVGAATARSGYRKSWSRIVLVSIHGWGTVKPARGFGPQRSLGCTQLPRCSRGFYGQQQYVTVTAQPYKGWKFAGWGRACRKSKTRTCTVDRSRFLPVCPVSIPPGVGPIRCKRQPYVLATFVPVAAGLTRKHPIPIGTAHKIGNGYTWRVNSTRANVQPASAPATGDEYFDADVTLTYTGSGSSIPLDHLDLNASSRLDHLYNADHGGGCPASDLQPRLNLVDPIGSGQSVTGHVCWTIATADAESLEMYFGVGSQDFYPGATWFALH